MVDTTSAFGIFRLISSENGEKPDTETPDPGGQPEVEVMGMEDEFDVPPLAVTSLSVAANDTIPEGARFEIVELGPDAESAVLTLTENGILAVRPLSFTSLITLTYRIVTSDGASEPIQVTIRVVNDLLIELTEDTLGNVTVPVLFIEDEAYPLFQFILTNSPFDSCGEPHYHANLFLVFPLGDPDSTGISDPNSSGCGFGKETDIVPGSLSILPGTWKNFLEKYRAANTP